MKSLLKILLFTFCIFLQKKSIAQCCTYHLAMHDSYGDGWNGGQLNVLINNVSIGNFSATNNGSIANFTVCNTDSIKLIYTAGNYENENTYQLYDSLWNLIYTNGPTPQVGIAYNALGNCSGLAMLGNNPCNAIPIDTLNCVWANNTNFITSGINPDCVNFTGKDVWFSMLVPASGNLMIKTDSGTINDTGLAVWTDSTCANIKKIDCNDDGGGNGYYSQLLLYNLIPGQKIFIQVFGYGTAQGSFKVCVKDLGTVKLDSTDLPLVKINTLGQPIVNDAKINAKMSIAFNGLNNSTYLNSVGNIYNGNIGIEIRGATSAGYPQKPYAIETRDSAGNNNDVSILNMPAENDWVLLSNFNDRSLIRNPLGCKLFGDMGNYSVHTNLCEVLIDSAYKGIYVFGEKIKRSNNRVPISKMDSTDIAGDNLTGGYILGQNYWDNSNSFQSNFSPIDHPTFDVHLLYIYPKPSDILAVQKTYIAAYVDSMEKALYGVNFADTATGFRKYLDVKSFIDYFLVNELSRNNDGFKKSVYFNKEKNSKGGKLKAGPVWDFDWAWKNIDNCNTINSFDGGGWAHKVNDCPTDNYSTGWYVRLLQDTTYNNEMRCAYEGYRKNILDTATIFKYIDSMGNRVKNAQLRHFKKWPILGVSGPAPEAGAIATTYSAELDTLKNWIATRLLWLDANIPGRCVPKVIVPNGIDNIKNSNAIQFYPNPSSGIIHFVGEQKYGDAVLIIYNVLGKKIMEKKIIKGFVNFDYLFTTKGFYYFTIMQNGKQVQIGKMVIE
jgi:CotH kinase protein